MLWERRIVETFESARILGVQRVEFLGLRRLGDDGRADQRLPVLRSGRPTSSRRRPGSRRSSTEEEADILTVYDDNGGYGHPDHIQVHRVGLRAAQMAGTPEVFQGTMNPTTSGAPSTAAERPDGGRRGRGARRCARPTRRSTASSFGKPEVELTHAVDVADLIEIKRASMVAHASQIAAGLVVPDHGRRGVRRGVRHGVVHPHRSSPGRGRADRDQPLDRRVILDLHDLWSWVVVIGNGIAGAWCLGAHWVPALRVKAHVGARGAGPGHDLRPGRARRVHGGGARASRRPGCTCSTASSRW